MAPPQYREVGRATDAAGGLSTRLRHRRNLSNEDYQSQSLERQRIEFSVAIFP